MTPKIRAEFITEDERRVLAEWGASMRPYLQYNGPQRRWKRVDLLMRAPPPLWEIRRRIADALGIEDIVEPMFQTYLSIIGEGGQIHRHTDPTKPGMEHLRCNLFLQLPDSGGMPIVEHVVCPVKARDLLYFTPNRHLHWCEEVGPGWRILLSYGFLVPQETFKTVFVSELGENNHENQPA